MGAGVNRLLPASSPQSFGRHGPSGRLLVPGRLLALEGQEAQLPNKMGIIATIPLREKSREKPYIDGSGQGSSGSSRTPRTAPGHFCRKPLQAPTPGPLISRKEPDPEK